jgi:hypothetical protein
MAGGACRRCSAIGNRKACFHEFLILIIYSKVNKYSGDINSRFEEIEPIDDQLRISINCRSVDYHNYSPVDLDIQQELLKEGSRWK